MNQCLQCHTPTKNPKYCSRSCSAKANNKNNRRWSNNNCCIRCKVWIKASRTYCDECFNAEKLLPYDRMTLKDLKAERKYQKHSKIRTHARKIFLNNNIRSCQLCGYDRHIEVHHIKPISSFNEYATIGEINDITNLAGLCRNCHWEVENGLVMFLPVTQSG